MNLEQKRPAEVDKIMSGISERYGLTHNRPGIHCTDCIYCLRKSFWNNVSPLPPSPKEMLFFIQGLGMQGAILGGDNPSIATLDGITISPDYWDGKVLGELKTTRMAEKTINEKGLPDGWVKQMMAYAHVLGVLNAFLIVMPIVKPDILSYVLVFDEQELVDNWNQLVQRSILLRDALDKNEPPIGDWGNWQCKDCRYNLKCNVLEGGTR